MASFDRRNSTASSSSLPLLAVGRVRDTKIIASVPAEPVPEEADKHQRCKVMVDKILKKNSKLEPGDFKRLTWEDGCFCLKLDESRSMLYLVYSTSKDYPDKLARELLLEVEEKVQSLRVDDDIIADASIDYNLLPKMVKLVEDYQTSRYEAHFLQVEREASRPPIRVSSPPASQAMSGWFCLRRMFIICLAIFILGAGGYGIWYFALRDKSDKSVQGLLILMA